MRMPSMRVLGFITGRSKRELFAVAGFDSEWSVKNNAKCAAKKRRLPQVTPCTHPNHLADSTGVAGSDR